MTFSAAGRRLAASRRRTDPTARLAHIAGDLRAGGGDTRQRDGVAPKHTPSPTSFCGRTSQPPGQPPGVLTLGLSGRRAELAMARTDRRFHGRRTTVRFATRRWSRRRRRSDLHRIPGASDLRLPVGPQRRRLPRARSHTRPLNRRLVRALYFYAHPLSESLATAALVAGISLVYPGRGAPSERRIFIEAP